MRAYIQSSKFPTYTLEVHQSHLKTSSFYSFRKTIDGISRYISHVSSSDSSKKPRRPVLTLLGVTENIVSTGLWPQLSRKLLWPSPPPIQSQHCSETEIDVWPVGLPAPVVARKAVGLLGSEVQTAPISGTLFDLNAVELTSGPFTMEITKEPAEHLTFGGSGNSPILRMLSVDSFFPLISLGVF